MLFAVPELDADDRRVLSEIDAFYESFNRSTGGSRSHEWVGGVRKRLVAGAIMGSNSIEGYTVDLSVASAIVSGASVPASVPDASREAVTGYRDALTWVLHMAEVDFFAHSEMVLSALHFMMIRSWRDKLPGRYRRGHIVVAGSQPLAPVYEAPAAEEVPVLMRELVAELNRADPGTPLLVKAALAHLDLVSIHPWRDGNGRMARCLQTLVIARGGRTCPEFCSIEEWLGFDINTYGYYQALSDTRRTYQPERSAHRWVRFCLRAHHEQAQTVDRNLRRGSEVWLAADELARRYGFNRRTIAALYAAGIDRLHRETYQGEEGLTRDQAVRDIRRLEQAGLVTAVGHGTTLHHLAAGELKRTVDEITASLTAPLTDPYAGSA